jgi:16S rRNA (cytidine1402-2'-O)-methyltransferase
MENQNKSPAIGTLWIAATTLGDLRDIPPRSLELLRTCQFLVFEEDKRARQFLKAAQVHRQWMRYTEQREQFTLEELKRELMEGNDALYMSDQGTPGLADPGRDLVNVAFEIGARVKVVPGPSSLTAAISICPIDCRRFLFAGFPPRDEASRENFMRQTLRESWPVAFFDTPYRMRPFFETMAKVLHGTNRKIFVALDISGPQEQTWWGHSEDILKRLSALPEKLNFVVIVEGTGLEKTKSIQKNPGPGRDQSRKQVFPKNRSDKTFKPRRPSTRR